jgi:hypothetical protein
MRGHYVKSDVLRCGSSRVIYSVPSVAGLFSSLARVTLLGEALLRLREALLLLAPCDVPVPVPVPVSVCVVVSCLRVCVCVCVYSIQYVYV